MNDPEDDSTSPSQPEVYIPTPREDFDRRLRRIREKMGDDEDALERFKRGENVGIVPRGTDRHGEI